METEKYIKKGRLVWKVVKSFPSSSTEISILFFFLLIDRLPKLLEENQQSTNFLSKENPLFSLCSVVPKAFSYKQPKPNLSFEDSVLIFMLSACFYLHFQLPVGTVLFCLFVVIK